jgi:ABC-type multidrug transport system ATPase subunit
LLRLADVSKRYGWGRWVLQGVDLEIPAGQVVAINGANGSGKSTLLRLLIGLTRPTTGTVSGQPPVIGYVPDRFPPNERLSATEYLTHMGRIRGLPTSVAAARADELMDRLELVGAKHSPLRTLSKGNAQKVALAQALLIQPQLLVLDEPWSGLDVSAHGVLASIHRDRARDGGTAGPWLTAGQRLISSDDQRGDIGGFDIAGRRVACHRFVVLVSSSLATQFIATRQD